MISSRPDAFTDAGRPVAVRAGVLASLAGLATFLAIHAVWITPIWFIAPAGIVIAAAGGAAFGLAVHEVRQRLPRRPWTAPAIFIAVGLILAPAFLVAELRGPIFAMGPDGGGSLLVPAAEATVDVALGLFGTCAASGAIVGWLVGRTRRAAATTALAALALAIGPGHNIPLLGGSPAAPKEILIVAAVLAVSCVVLVEADAWLVRRSAA